MRKKATNTVKALLALAKYLDHVRTVGYEQLDVAVLQYDTVARVLATEPCSISELGVDLSLLLAAANVGCYRNFVEEHSGEICEFPLWQLFGLNEPRFDKLCSELGEIAREYCTEKTRLQVHQSHHSGEKRRDQRVGGKQLQSTGTNQF